MSQREWGGPFSPATPREDSCWDTHAARDGAMDLTQPFPSSSQRSREGEAEPPAATMSSRMSCTSPVLRATTGRRYCRFLHLQVRVLRLTSVSVLPKCVACYVPRAGSRIKTPAPWPRSWVLCHQGWCGMVWRICLYTSKRQSGIWAHTLFFMQLRFLNLVVLWSENLYFRWAEFTYVKVLCDKRDRQTDKRQDRGRRKGKKEQRLV